MKILSKLVLLLIAVVASLSSCTKAYQDLDPETYRPILQTWQASWSFNDRPAMVSLKFNKNHTASFAVQYQDDFEKISYNFDYSISKVDESTYDITIDKWRATSNGDYYSITSYKQGETYRATINNTTLNWNNKRYERISKYDHN